MKVVVDYDEKYPDYWPQPMFADIVDETLDIVVELTQEELMEWNRALYVIKKIEKKIEAERRYDDRD